MSTTLSPEQSAEEIKSLQRCIDDLISALALPAIWTGGAPSHVVATLLDALLSMLHLDFAYAAMPDPAGGTPIEILRLSPSQTLDVGPQEMGALLSRVLGLDQQTWPAVVRSPLSAVGDVALVPMRLGLQCHTGLIVAASHRADFPRRTERLLMSVAANQAAIALQEARLLIQQKREASELESEFHLRQAMEAIPTMLCRATAEGMVDYINGRLLEYTGFSAEKLMGEGWAKTKIVHPDDLEQAIHAWTSALTTGTQSGTGLRIWHAADRTYRWCTTCWRPLLDSQGRILKWYAELLDVHDWRQAQEELRNTQAELGHMARVMTMGVLTASIAHEVNQPLAGIITNANTCLRMLAADPANVEGARETARRTIRDANRASDVIARLRALFAKKDIAAEWVDLNEATREVIALCSGNLQRNRVLLRVELDNDLPPVIGDRVQLQQVMLNLLSNASDAMLDVDDRARELLIRTELDDASRLRLTVRDAGVGFSPQDAERLFAAFYTTKHGGMGIGLSVSRSIIESHHGHLWAATNDGPGATFCFSIPCGPQSPTHAPGPSRA